MTETGDNQGHKPSPKHTLEEVRKSLEDMVRHELEGARSSSGERAPNTPGEGTESPATIDTPEAPPSTLPGSAPKALDTGQLLRSLNDLLDHELGETQGDQAIPAEPVDESVEAEVSATPPAHESTEASGVPSVADSEVSEESEDIVIETDVDTVMEDNETGAIADSEDQPAEITLEGLDQKTADIEQQGAVGDEITTDETNVAAEPDSADVDLDMDAQEPDEIDLDVSAGVEEEVDAIELAKDADGVEQPEDVLDEVEAPAFMEASTLEIIDILSAPPPIQQAFIFEDPTLRRPIETHELTASDQDVGDTRSTEVTLPEPQAARQLADSELILESGGVPTAPEAESLELPPVDAETLALDEFGPIQGEIEKSQPIEGEIDAELDDSEPIEGGIEAELDVSEPSEGKVDDDLAEKHISEIGTRSADTSSLFAEDTAEEPALLDALEVPGGEQLSEGLTEKDSAETPENDVAAPVEEPATDSIRSEELPPGNETPADSLDSASTTETVTESTETPDRRHASVPAAAPRDESESLKMPGIDFGDRGTQKSKDEDTSVRSDATAGAKDQQIPSEPLSLSNTGPLFSENADAEASESEFIDLGAPPDTQSLAPNKGSRREGPSTPLAKPDLQPPSRPPKAKPPPSLDSKHAARSTKHSPSAKAPSMEDIPILDEVVAGPSLNERATTRPGAATVTQKTVPKPKMPADKVTKRSKAPRKQARGDPRNLAVQVVAKLNMELRKCGERTLSPVTIDRLQYLLREALEQQGSDVDN